MRASLQGFFDQRFQRGLRDGLLHRLSAAPFSLGAERQDGTLRNTPGWYIYVLYIQNCRNGILAGIESEKS